MKTTMMATMTATTRTSATSATTRLVLVVLCNRSSYAGGCQFSALVALAPTLCTY